jgi:hypothetical protein
MRNLQIDVEVEDTSDSGPRRDWKRREGRSQLRRRRAGDAAAAASGRPGQVQGYADRILGALGGDKGGKSRKQRHGRLDQAAPHGTLVELAWVTFGT